MGARRAHLELLADIRRLADPEYGRGSLRVAPTSQRVHGVRVPDLRRLARTWRGQHRDASPEHVLGLVESLWNAESRDERMLGLEILRLRSDVVRDLDTGHFDRWRADIDNWGVCDFLGSAVLGPWAGVFPDERLPYVERLVGDPDRWSRRLALVTSVPLNRDSDAYVTWTLVQVDRVLDDRDPMITKAVSWVLRELTRRDAPAVEAYVLSRADRMAALPRREVRNKLRTGRKSGRAG